MKFPLRVHQSQNGWHLEDADGFIALGHPSEGEELVRRANAFDELVRRYGDALLYIETYGGEVTASYAAAGNLEDNKHFLKELKG